MIAASGQKTLRIGIAGLGFGVDVHLPGFRGVPGVEVTGLLGRDPARAAAVAVNTGLPVSIDFDTRFDVEFDAVSLAMPPLELGRATAAAIDRGLPVLCEKPFGPDCRSARTLAARAAGRPNAVDFEFAELESFVALHEAIHAGMIGRVRHVAVMWLMASRAHRGGGWSWKTDAIRHGGVLTLLGTHVFYMLEWLLEPIARLSARIDCRATARLCRSPDAMPADDLANVTLEYRDGATASVAIGNANPDVAVHRWTIVGDGGTAILGNTTRDLADSLCCTVFSPDGQAIRQTADTGATGDRRIAPFRRLAVRFVEAVRAGGHCRPDFDDGARVAVLVDAVRRSAETGTWIETDAKVPDR
jgi:predicted dehydrogenase